MFKGYSRGNRIAIAPLLPYSDGMIKAVKFVSLPVKDQDQALAFYTHKLGFQILTDQPFDGGQRWIELSISGAETRLVLFTASGHETRIGTFSNITFMTDNVEKTYRELSGRGVEFQGAPKKEPWGTSAIFKDLDGNAFVLSSR
jgi:catechol 2,3-dioxygenase-like lactoylglutathione lyase family enzyme